jgi:hypothetical protein
MLCHTGDAVVACMSDRGPDYFLLAAIYSPAAVPGTDPFTSLCNKEHDRTVQSSDIKAQCSHGVDGSRSWKALCGGRLAKSHPISQVDLEAASPRKCQIHETGPASVCLMRAFFLAVLRLVKYLCIPWVTPLAYSEKIPKGTKSNRAQVTRTLSSNVHFPNHG